MPSAGACRIPSCEADGVAVGTRVLLRPRADDAALVAAERVRDLASHYGRHLPCRVLVARGTQWETITGEPPFLGSDDGALAALGREVVGAEPLDVIPIDVPGTGTRGVAYVLPFSPPMGARQSHRVYLGRMLLSDRHTDIAPDWAFFVRLVVNTDGLSPTASREQLLEDASLEFTRDEIGRILRGWLLRQATMRPHVFARFAAVHDLAIKSVALDDARVAAAVVPYLAVETSLGTMTLGDLVARHKDIRFTRTVDEFRQVAAIAPADAPVVNGGYTYDADLLRLLPDLHDDMRVTRVRVGDVLDELDPTPLAHRAAATALEHRVDGVLAGAGCAAMVRVFHPSDVPALFVADPDLLRTLDRRHARDAAPPLWAGLLDEVDDELAGRGASRQIAARLCLNWSNPVVQRLTVLGDDVVFDRVVQVLHVQSLLAGHHPLRNRERSALTTALTDLIHLSVGLEQGETP